MENQTTMFKAEQYQLLDFGHSEKLESFAGIVVRRRTPTVAPDAEPDSQIEWNPNLRFDKESKSGNWSGDEPVNWQIKHGRMTFLLQPTPAGQVGLFPEQAVNWSWIESLPKRLDGLNALNLFGYTGGTTLALASRGAKVVHIDSARNVMKWARQNAAASQMQDLPIRWIVEDAMKFVARESGRGSKYDILVADPPSFGTGTKKERWKFAADIQNLMAGLVEISAARLRMLLLTCHTPGFDTYSLKRLVAQHFELNDVESESFAMNLRTASGKKLHSGSCFRFARLS